MNSTMRTACCILVVCVILLATNNFARAQFGNFEGFSDAPTLREIEEGSAMAGMNTTSADFQAIIDLITKTVEPENWETWGGPGVISEFESIPPVIITTHPPDTSLLGIIRRWRNQREGFQILARRRRQGQESDVAPPSDLTDPFGETSLDPFAPPSNPSGTDPFAPQNEPASDEIPDTDPFATDTPPNRTAPASDADRPKSSQADFSAIIALITETVEPESWDLWGGPGVISEYEGNLSLVIRHGGQVLSSPAVVQPNPRFDRLRIMQRIRERRHPKPNPQMGGGFSREGDMW